MLPLILSSDEIKNVCTMMCSFQSSTGTTCLLSSNYCICFSVKKGHVDYLFDFVNLLVLL